MRAQDLPPFHLCALMPFHLCTLVPFHMSVLSPVCPCTLSTVDSHTLSPHVPSCPFTRYLGWGGVGTLAGVGYVPLGTPPPSRPGQGGRYLGQGVGTTTPHPELDRGVSTLAGGGYFGTLGYPFLPILTGMGVGTLARGSYLGQGG